MRKLICGAGGGRSLLLQKVMTLSTSQRSQLHLGLSSQNNGVNAQQTVGMLADLLTLP